LDDCADLPLVGGVDGDAFFGGEVRDLEAQIVHRGRTLNEEGRRHLNSGWEQSEPGGTRMGTNLASIVTESAARDAGAAGIRLGERTLTYGELDDRAARLATLLRERGVEHGGRGGVMLPNVPEFPIAYYGILRAGGVVVPMNVLLKRREIAYYLEDSGAKLLLAWHGFLEDARTGAADAGCERIDVEPGSFAATLDALEPTLEIAAVDDEDTAVILYTSGTTGQPKGAELSHLNLVRNADVSAHTNTTVGPGGIVLG